MAVLGTAAPGGAEGFGQLICPNPGLQSGFWGCANGSKYKKKRGYS